MRKNYSHKKEPHGQMALCFLSMQYLISKNNHAVSI